MGAKTVAGASPRTRQRAVDDLDELHVLRDGEPVQSLENPTNAEFRRLQESLDSNEVVVDSLVEPNCMTYCKEDCDVACDGEDCQYSHTCASDQYCCELEEN